jgi:hypothetical protein
MKRERVVVCAKERLASARPKIETVAESILTDFVKIVA